jgi:hypothetical protein
MAEAELVSSLQELRERIRFVVESLPMGRDGVDMSPYNLMPWQIVRVHHNPEENAFSPVVLDVTLEDLLQYIPGGKVGGKVKTASAGNVMVARMRARNFLFTIGGQPAYRVGFFGENQRNNEELLEFTNRKQHQVSSLKVVLDNFGNHVGTRANCLAYLYSQYNRLPSNFVLGVVVTTEMAQVRFTRITKKNKGGGLGVLNLLNFGGGKGSNMDEDQLSEGAVGIGLVAFGVRKTPYVEGARPDCECSIGALVLNMKNHEDLIKAGIAAGTAVYKHPHDPALSLYFGIYNNQGVVGVEYNPSQKAKLMDFLTEWSRFMSAMVIWGAVSFYLGRQSIPVENNLPAENRVCRAVNIPFGSTATYEYCTPNWSSGSEAARVGLTLPALVTLFVRSSWEGASALCVAWGLSTAFGQNPNDNPVVQPLFSTGTAILALGYLACASITFQAWRKPKYMDEASMLKSLCQQSPFGVGFAVFDPQLLSSEGVAPFIFGDKKDLCSRLSEACEQVRDDEQVGKGESSPET